MSANKKLKGERRQSSLSAGLQKNIVMDSNTLIQEVNESSMSSQEIDSSCTERRNAGLTIGIHSLEATLPIPTHIIKVQSEQPLLDHISN